MKEKLPFYTENVLKDHNYDWHWVCSKYILTEDFIDKYIGERSREWSPVCWYFEDFNTLSDIFLIKHHHFMNKAMRIWRQDFPPYVEKRQQFIKVLGDRGIIGPPKYFNETT